MGVHGSTTAIITMMMVMMVTVTVMVAVTVMVMTMVVPAFVGYMPHEEPHPPSHFNVAYKPDAQILFVTVS